MTAATRGLDNTRNYLGFLSQGGEALMVLPH